MLRLQQVQPKDMPEVVRIAAELYQEDQTQLEVAEQRQGMIQAAAELDVPAEYLERAAAVLHTQRVEAVRRRRRTRGLIALPVAALALWSVWWFRSLPPSPTFYDFSTAPARQWVLNRNPESAATIDFSQEAGHGGVAAIRVERFGARDRDGTYFVNLDTSDVPRTLAGYRTVTFRARGAGLGSVRLYLEAGATERWRSPPLSLSSDWQEHRLRLDQFDHQTRRSPSEEWRRQSYRPPGPVERLSFKLGTYVNEPSAQGSVVLDDLRFE